MRKVLMSLAVVGLLVVVGVCLNGCTGSSGSNPQNGGNAVIPPKENTAIPSNLTPAQQALVDALPPDPGEAGKATIEGIDSDHDGVRDDVQRYIVLNYLDSAKTRAALTLSAKAQQDFFADYLAHLGEDQNLESVRTRVRAVADIGAKAQYCLSYVFGVRPGFSIDDEPWQTYRKTNRELHALFMDTPERFAASYAAERPLVATGYPDVQREQYRQECLDLGLNPDTLPN